MYSKKRYRIFGQSTTLEFYERITTNIEFMFFEQYIRFLSNFVEFFIFAIEDDKFWGFLFLLISRRLRDRKGEKQKRGSDETKERGSLNDPKA